MDRNRDTRLTTVDDQLFKAIHARVHLLTGAASGVIALTITLSTLGHWPAFIASVIVHSILFPLNIFFDWRVIPRIGIRGEIYRATFNHLLMAVTYAWIGWPLTSWLWLPFVALSVNDANHRVSLAINLIVCSTMSAGALWYGVQWEIPATMTALALLCWRLSHARTAVIQDMINEMGRQHDELARTELELRQAQKLEAIGRLAAGVAHEINTPMQFVSDNLAFVSEGATELLALAQDCASPEKAQSADLAYLGENMPAALEHARAGVQRVASIVRSMKEFAHPGGSEDGPIDINAAITNTLTIANYEYKLVADVETELTELPPMRGNGSELNQVLLNLIINASHAIADVATKTGRRGTIRIATRPDGDHVVVVIADSGGGIRDSIRMKVFDPFFTTKEVGRGTGQGLSISRSIIERHGGQLSFDSNLGVGTTFTIRLPIAPPAALAA